MKIRYVSKKSIKNIDHFKGKITLEMFTKKLTLDENSQPQCIADNVILATCPELGWDKTVLVNPIFIVETGNIHIISITSEHNLTDTDFVSRLSVRLKLISAIKHIKGTTEHHVYKREQFQIQTVLDFYKKFTKKYKKILKGGDTHA